MYWIFGSVASDLDVMKVCKVIQIPGMLISKDKIIMSHMSWWPMRKLRRWSL